MSLFLDEETDEKYLYTSVSLNGEDPQVAKIAVSWSTAPNFTELRFRGAPSALHSGGEVCEFRWFGGEINDAQGLDEPDMRDVFTDLSFLSGP